MAVPLTWGGGESVAWSSGAVPGAFGGSPIDPAIDRRRPHAPGEFKVSVVGDFTIKVSWKDHGAPGELASAHPIFVQLWEVRACPVANAGTQGGDDTAWRRSVLAKSHVIGSMPSSNRGAILSMSIVDDTLQDSYIQVVGYSADSYTQGYPTEPISILTTGVPVGALDPVTQQSVILSGFEDSYGNKFVDITTRYRAPLDFGRFLGVSLQAAGYLGTPEPQQLGNLLISEQPRAGYVQRNVIRMASDKDLWHGGYAAGGTVDVINGSDIVTQGSGNPFDDTDAWAGKVMAIIGSGFTIPILTATDASFLQLTSNFTGITGTYDAIVLNPVVFYFVSVDRSGHRTTDSTTAPSASANGIFFL